MECYQAGSKRIAGFLSAIQLAVVLVLLASSSHTQAKDDDSSVHQNKTATVRTGAVSGSMAWMVDALELKKHKYRNFQITRFEVSDDKRYAIVNISNGKPSETAGPFYRFAVINPSDHKIYFPSMETLHSESLGYPYISAKFNENNLIAIAYGYRVIMASVIALPEGKEIEKMELELADVDEIDKELIRLLEKHAQ